MENNILSKCLQNFYRILQNSTQSISKYLPRICYTDIF